MSAQQLGPWTVPNRPSILACRASGPYQWTSTELVDRLLLPLITDWWHTGRDVTHCSVSGGRYWHIAAPAFRMAEISIARLGSPRLCRLLLDIYDRHQAIAISRYVVPLLQRPYVSTTFAPQSGYHQEQSPQPSPQEDRWNISSFCMRRKKILDWENFCACIIRILATLLLLKFPETGHVSFICVEGKCFST